jgi:hypothetical protein
MKNRKNISESRLSGIFRSYYASELKEAKSDYPYRADRQPVNGGRYLSRRNKIINFVFPALLAAFTVICLTSYRSPTPLGEAINRFYISNELDKKIPQAVKFLADRVQFTKP